MIACVGREIECEARYPEYRKTMWNMAKNWMVVLVGAFGVIASVAYGRDFCSFVRGEDCSGTTFRNLVVTNRDISGSDFEDCEFELTGDDAYNLFDRCSMSKTKFDGSEFAGLRITGGRQESVSMVEASFSHGLMWDSAFIGAVDMTDSTVHCGGGRDYVFDGVTMNELVARGMTDECETEPSSLSLENGMFGSVDLSLSTIGLAMFSFSSNQVSLAGAEPGFQRPLDFERGSVGRLDFDGLQNADVSLTDVTVGSVVDPNLRISPSRMDGMSNVRIRQNGGEWNNVLMQSSTLSLSEDEPSVFENVRWTSCSILDTDLGCAVFENTIVMKAVDFKGSHVGGVTGLYAEGECEMFCEAHGCVCDTAAPCMKTPTPTPTPTAPPTSPPTAAPTASPTLAPTATSTPLPTAPPTATPTPLPTATPTALPTLQPTETPTAVPTPPPTAAPTSGPTALPSATPTAAPTASPIPPPIGTPSALPTATAFPTTAPPASPTPTQTPAQTKEPVASETPAPTKEPVASETPIETSSASPTPSSLETPTPVPSSEATATPSDLPQVETPSATPSGEPTQTPTAAPSEAPTSLPSSSPTPDSSVPPAPGTTSTPTATPTPSSAPPLGGSFVGPVCIDASWVATEHAGFEVHTSATFAQVLCYGTLPCATDGHVLARGDELLTMRELCASEKCERKAMYVNGVQHRRNHLMPCDGNVCLTTLDDAVGSTWKRVENAFVYKLLKADIPGIADTLTQIQLASAAHQNNAVNMMISE